MKDTLQSLQAQRLTKSELLRSVAENLIESPTKDLEGIAIRLREDPDLLLSISEMDDISDRLDRVKSDIEGIFLAINTLDRFYTH